jgi:hypothetical protein
MLISNQKAVQSMILRLITWTSKCGVRFGRSLGGIVSPPTHCQLQCNQPKTRLPAIGWGTPVSPEDDDECLFIGAEESGREPEGTIETVCTLKEKKQSPRQTETAKRFKQAKDYAAKKKTAPVVKVPSNYKNNGAREGCSGTLKEELDY